MESWTHYVGWWIYSEKLWIEKYVVLYFSRYSLLEINTELETVYNIFHDSYLFMFLQVLQILVDSILKDEVDMSGVNGIP